MKDLLIRFGNSAAEVLGRATSRKFIAALFAAVVPILNEHYGWGIPTETMLAVIAAFAAYIGVEGYADAKRVK